MNHSRGTSKKSYQSWQTPPALFEKIQDFYGAKFGIDLASSDENHFCENWITEKENTLSISPTVLADRIFNAGGYGWNNPPYNDGNIGQWLHHMGMTCKQRDDIGISVLMPNNKTEQPWWGEMIELYKPSLGFITPRVAFIGENGKLGKQPNHGSLLIGFGEYLQGFGNFSLEYRPEKTKKTKK